MDGSMLIMFSHSVLTLMRFHGGVWDKKLTHMCAVCAKLKGTKLLASLLDGKQFTVFGFAENEKTAQRSTLEILIEYARGRSG